MEAKALIRDSSAVKYMEWAAPLYLGVIGEEAEHKHDDAHGATGLNFADNFIGLGYGT